VIERAILAVAVLGAVAAVGFLLQSRNGRRRSRVRERERIDASGHRFPVVLAFSGPGCASCATQRRILRELIADLDGRLHTRFVDAVSDPELALRYGVCVVPTTVVATAKGRIVEINAGLIHKEPLLQQIESAI
jgi:thioredoxin-like negative regulator of GroEL